MSKSEQTKAFIIEKTAPIFNQKGYAGTSLKDMTEATNLTKGSIYGNFANKDEVALAAFDYNLGRVNAIIHREVAKHTVAREKLKAYGYIYTDAAGYSFPTGGCPVLNTATESDDTHPELRKKAVSALQTWKKNLITILENGKDNKEFSKNLNSEQIALTMLALIEGGIMIAKVTGKPAYQTKILDSLNQFVDGLI